MFWKTSVLYLWNKRGLKWLLLTNSISLIECLFLIMVQIFEIGAAFATPFFCSQIGSVIASKARQSHGVMTLAVSEWNYFQSFTESKKYSSVDASDCCTDHAFVNILHRVGWRNYKFPKILKRSFKLRLGRVEPLVKDMKAFCIRLLYGLRLG